MRQINNLNLLDNIIIGRIDPQIYAFSTETIPNFLKVGDTYRPLSVRLAEWRIHYPNLLFRYSKTARLESGKFFRDYAVHQYLENTKKLHRLTKEELGKGIYYSCEFFKNAKVDDVKEAIEDIKKNESKNKYQYYSPDKLPIKYEYKRNQTFSPRQNQQDAIDAFKHAYLVKGRTNLLMYAVMRFGKSFTAMCCATEINAHLVVIVSAKADVREEWKKAVESHVRFERYKFLEGSDLLQKPHIIKECAQNHQDVAIFLTLQDLQGERIKEKHQELFQSSIDLLIIDETHYGARAAEYGKVLQDNKLSKSEIQKETEDIDFSDDFDKEIKTLKAKVRIHLSGTPYRILMGDEFTKDDIISFCQYSDIVDAKEDWDKENGNKDQCQEWDNPYYGFPQMVRFAFLPNTSARIKMKELRENGISYAFSALFRPKSMTKDREEEHRIFMHEKEILDLFLAIDGAKEDENILSFLDYDKIQEGKMCRHIVCVLPFRASCDALAYLLQKYHKKFKHLCKYQIINIAGYDEEKIYKSTSDVKNKIEECEEGNKKTLSLTVNKMLTGSTVKQWDTMLYFKDTASPQEYDQAIFRIQNQYVKTYKDQEGNIIKYDMKPQTLLVDFDPDRMFRMQELKSQFYNANTEKNGNNKLEKRIERELEISPIITLNKNQLKEVKATDVMAVVQQYSNNKSILDEATSIPCDFSLLNDQNFKDEVEKLNKIDASKGVDFKPNEGDDESDYAIPETEETEETEEAEKDKEGKEHQTKDKQDEENDIAKKIAAYYSKILFYAFLTDTPVKTLEDVINSIVNKNESNHRIAKNLGLKVPILWLIQNKCNPFVLSKLDYKISSINSLMSDKTLSPLERAQVATKRFTRISDSEVVIPAQVATSLVDFLPKDKIDAKTIFLDIASTQGEMALAIYQKYGATCQAENNIYSVPTYPLAYELTRKMYQALGLPINHIFNSFYANAIVDKNNEKIIQELAKLHPNVVIGGAAFNKNDAGGRGDSATALYHKYFQLAKEKLAPQYISMYMKSVWYSGGKGEGLRDFRKDMLADERIEIFHDYPDPAICDLSGINLRGGVCLLLWNSAHKGQCEFVSHINNHTYSEKRYLRTGSEDILIRFSKGIPVLTKVKQKAKNFVGEEVSSRDPFGFGDKFKDYTDESQSVDTIKIYDVKKKSGYIKKCKLNDSYTSLSKKWKVLVAKASPGGDELPHSVISSPIVSEPNSVCTNGLLLIRTFNNQKEADNFAAYMCTKFFRFMMILAKNGHNMTKHTYQYVPVLDFKKEWTDKKLYKHFCLTQEEQAFIEEIIRDKG